MCDCLVLALTISFGLNADAPKFFGFSEFLASLALMVLAWTIADVRYRFRIMTAPLPLQRVTFFTIAGVGILTLLTDLWRAEEWPIPLGGAIPDAVWQAILGGTFLLTFLLWVWFAFIWPPIYGKWNAMRYARQLYRAILKGNSTELAIIADEIKNSIKSLVQYATERNDFPDDHKENAASEPDKVRLVANDILALIADKRFCRAIVESSPGTVLTLFRVIGETGKFRIPIGTFCNNIVNEALADKNSFLYHETEGYKTGLIGHLKPLTQAMYADYRMVETIGALLDPDIRATYKWDADQWKAYSRIVLTTFRDYAEKDIWNHSYTLYRAKGNIERAVSDLYKLNGSTTFSWDDDILQRLEVVIDFIKQAIQILEKHGVPEQIKLRVHQKHPEWHTFYDYLANMICEVILDASAVTSPSELCWHVQHNSIWTKLFGYRKQNGPVQRMVNFKVRRLIYDEIKEMETSPNFKSAHFLAYCLNCMGFEVKEEDHTKENIALHKAVLAWTKKNFARLHAYDPRVAEACLVDGMTYDSASPRLVLTYPAKGLRREARHIYFAIDPTPTEVEMEKHEE
ncbi:MAG: hypothetical protein JW936_07770 [Sedimentisphaerales bacterium]|nr:hypothetical protein [Sedimentisphaerales bacterium]